MERAAYIRNQGYELVSMWECQFNDLCKSDPELREFVKHRQLPFDSVHSGGRVNAETLLRAVQEGEFFGMVEVDIEVPEDRYEYFAEMSPIFVTCKVPFERFGKRMQKHIRKNKLSRKPRTLLVGGMRARQVLLATPLLQWYLTNGLVVSKIYQAVEYRGEKCFKQFTEKVTKCRRLGDSDPDFAIMGEVFKLIGNSAYGLVLMDKSRHTNCNYINGENTALCAVNRPRFQSLCELDDGDYELISIKRTMVLDLPIVLGYFVLQYAKLQMISFYFGFLDRFISRRDFELLQTDTDSLYFALSEDSLRDVIKPDMIEEYDTMLNGFCHSDNIEPTGNLFLPRTCCSEHIKHDKRTLGLFKLEAEGIEMISLASKTYILRKDTVGNEVKISSKGLSSKNISNPVRAYRNVLRKQRDGSSVNVGFRARNNTIFTYRQRRACLSYFYIKRRLRSDGITTRPLRMTLKPASHR